MKNKTHIGCSPITGEIFAGKLIANGTMWRAGKQNVTNEAFNAVAQSILITDKAMEFTYSDGETYILQVVKAKKQSKKSKLNTINK
jgi:hypothetical protein